jgi:hypothetical protein
MKTIIGALVLVGVMFGAIHLIDGTPNEYVKENTMEVVEEPKEAWMTDEDAVKAAQDVIKRKELEADLTSLEASFASSTEAYETEEKTYKIKKMELEKELGTY